jgi:hypothetical protein
VSYVCPPQDILSKNIRLSQGSRFNLRFRSHHSILLIFNGLHHNLSKEVVIKLPLGLLAHEYTSTMIIFYRSTSVTHNLEDIHDMVVNVMMFLAFIILDTHGDDHMAHNRETPCSVLMRKVNFAGDGMDVARIICTLEATKTQMVPDSNKCWTIHLHSSTKKTKKRCDSQVSQRKGTIPQDETCPFHKKGLLLLPWFQRQIQGPGGGLSPKERVWSSNNKKSCDSPKERAQFTRMKPTLPSRRGCLCSPGFKVRSRATEGGFLPKKGTNAVLENFCKASIMDIFGN